MEDEVRYIFPSVEQCLVCFNEDGSWDEASVFAFLEKTYWSGPNASGDRLLTSSDAMADGSGGILRFMLFAAVLIVAGLWKKLDTSSGLRSTMRTASAVGRKLGDKFHGKKHKV
jgi:hypothetical protein